MDDHDDFWVFGYGSLMWDPGFDFLERQPALLRGYHRAFCLYSHHYRGTPERPGLVLGLDRGGSCRGMAYRVADALKDSVQEYLYAREMLHYVYDERMVPVALPDRRVLAHTYVADRSHEQYARLTLEETARLIAQGCGERGKNRDYLENTVQHLDELGVADGPLHDLRDRVRQLYTQK
ncbi:MAG: gamma-glutamylcyclotransferase [Alphaproteobacteria bacterium]|nr:gamma-glutamylcyclotransferase [Alphaproteobacteria bacterium]